MRSFITALLWPQTRANGEAKDGLRRVGDVLISRFNDAISGAHYSDAALALATLKLVEPSDSHLGPFQLQLSTAEISKAFADGNADRAAALLRQVQQSGAFRPRSLPPGVPSSRICSRPTRYRASHPWFSIASAAMS